jgi:peroxiredoxin
MTHDKAFDISMTRDWQNCIKGKSMPYFSLETISGEKIETQKLLGKVLVINLWFAGCKPCVAEIPALNQLATEYKNMDVVFLGISTDDRQTLKSDFLPRHPFKFTIIPDGDSIVERIGHTGFPTTYIIDKRGTIKDAWIGGEMGEGAKTAAYRRAKPIIDELLKLN